MVITFENIKVSSFLNSNLFESVDKIYDNKICNRKYQKLTNDELRNILDFLNQWGCRQVIKSNFNETIKNLFIWLEDNEEILNKFSNRDLFTINNELIEEYFNILFESLMKIECGVNKNGIRKTFGKVGAAKCLFAINHNVFPPTDNPIWNYFSESGKFNPNDYSEFSKMFRNIGKPLYNLNLPKEVERENVSLIKLIDEFLWLKITKKIDLDYLVIKT